ncbi:MAG: M23 family metallopeptidase [Spirochaetes bacterium]|nr:M23 family metallopeptidase [Spirochaetota bacterium]
MTNRALFIDRPRARAIPSSDKKRELIQNQKIVQRKKKQQPQSSKRTLFESVRIKSIAIKRGVLLITGTSVCAILFLIPLFLDIKSYLWEKARVAYTEEDLVYNLFLMEGGANRKAEQSALTTGISDGEFIVPKLRVVNYTVTKGDSLFGIARKFNVSVDAIITANELKNAYYLRTGSVLLIPSMSGIYYTVKKGDSLFGIAKRYGAEVNRIADVNDLDSSVIRSGTRLFIPAGTLTAWERASAIGEVFKSPVKGRISSRMGFRQDPFTNRRAYHTGVDIAAKSGTTVRASQFGRVLYSGYHGNYGKTVIIVHPQGYETLYAHLDKITVKRGQAVQQGDGIGTVGSTGRSTGPHLHFEVHQNGKLVDPLKVVRVR